jgi:hypothetical protein
MFVRRKVTFGFGGSKKKMSSCTVCAIMKDERPYIAEWVAYYRILGFDRIVIYSNDSSDGSDVVLSKLASLGVITHFDWPSGERSSPQIAAYTDAVDRCTTDWILFVDADEFLLLNQHRTASQFLAGFGADVSGIAVNWRLFGSSGLRESDGRLVIERFRMASHPQHYINHHVKTFVRPTAVLEGHVHACKLRGQYVTASGIPFVFSRQGIGTQIDTTVAQINHYLTKSRAEYDLKRRRGNANRALTAPDKFLRYDDQLFIDHDCNDVLDERITRFVPAVQSMISSWEIS